MNLISISLLVSEILDAMSAFNIPGLQVKYLT